MYTLEEKQKIKSAFDTKCQRQQFTRNKAATSMNLSAATLSQVFSGSYPADDTNIWKQIILWCDYHETRTLKLVDTRNHKLLEKFVNDARLHATTYAIMGDAGSGKTFSLKNLAASLPHVYLVQCHEYWNMKDYMGEILRSMGRDNNGMSITEMINGITEILRMENDTVLIIDEADKLKDPLFIFFITLYNRLEDHTGLILTATNHIEKRIMKGLRLNRRGYQEIYSRFGRRFVELNIPNKYDIVMICDANGVTDPAAQEEIVKNSMGDLRRVKKLIHQHNLRNAS